MREAGGSAGKQASEASESIAIAAGDGAAGDEEIDGTSESAEQAGRWRGRIGIGHENAGGGGGERFEGPALGAFEAEGILKFPFEKCGPVELCDDDGERERMVAEAA